MATVSIVESNQWQNWASNWPSKLQFFIAALNALTARQSYVQNVHPEWNNRYQQLRQQGNALYAQMSALQNEYSQVRAYFARTAQKDPLGSVAGSVVSSVLGPLSTIFFAPDTSVTVSYDINQAETIQNSAQQWGVLANNFVSQCDAAYRQEQAGATPAQTSAMSGANVSSALPVLPSTLPTYNIPILSDIASGVGNFVGSIGTTAKWIAIVGVGVVALPMIIEAMQGARRGRR